MIFENIKSSKSPITRPVYAPLLEPNINERLITKPITIFTLAPKISIFENTVICKINVIKAIIKVFNLFIIQPTF